MKKKFFFLNFFLILLSIFFFSLKIWLFRYFGNVDLDQLLIFFNFGFKGLLDAEDYVIKKFYQICILLPISISIILTVLLKYLRINDKITILSSSIFFVISITYLSIQLDFNNTHFTQSSNDYFKTNYKRPILNSNKSSQKDLLIVYLESFEENYLETYKLKKDVLTDISFENLKSKKINYFEQTKYNNYTIGGIVSSQCGIPQKKIGILDTRLMFNENNKRKHTKLFFGLKNFLPNAICLSDILKYNGYKNFFIHSIGSEFQAMDVFLEDHNYEIVFDKNYFIKNGYKNLNSWGNGVNDVQLFNKAKNLIDELKDKNQRFNLSILTTDTHAPGYIDQSCPFKNLDVSSLEISVKCTALSLNYFINHIYKKYGDTISIVIIGDHLYPLDNNEKKQRYIYNRIITKKKLNRNKITHYDLFPSLLHLVNLDYGNHLGLGHSFLSKKIDVDYDLYLNELKNNIKKESKYYYEFWN